MESVNIRTLGPGAKVALCWSFFWRGILVTFGSMVVGGLLGGVLGFLVAATGISRGTGLPLVQGLGVVAGGLTGCWFFYLYVRWLLTSRLGGFRLLLVRADAGAQRQGPDTVPMAR